MGQEWHSDPVPQPSSARPTPRPTQQRRLIGRVSSALIAVLAVVTGLLVALAAPASADPTPPPNPTDAQIGSVQQQKTALANRVGALTAQLTQQQAQVQQLQGEAELAEQKYANAVTKLDEAVATAATAKTAVATAQTEVDKARAAFNASVRANYTQGGVQGGAGALLAADDPDQMLQSSSLQSYVTEHQADGIGQLNRAKVAKANADAAARTAVAAQTQLTAEADQAMQDARVAETAAKTQEQALAASQATTQSELSTAYNALQKMLGQRTTYNEFRAEQRRQEAARLAALQAKQAAEAAAAAAAAAKAAAAAAAANAGNGNTSSGNSGGTSSGGSSGGGNTYSGGGQSSGNPSGGAWTAAKGQDAVNRAMAYLGTKYSFAAGNFSGPTYGRCGSNDDGWNDCNVFGFDCSGLTLYGWAPYMHLDHYSVTQYNQAGSYHPSTGDLLPGDLLFWSNNGSLSSVHHVAMYIGNGNVIQAPHSGDVVKITSLWNVSPGYFGATRPLT